MSTTEFNKYINSAEFKELLARYEAVVKAHELVYFDADDLIDIAEAYHVWGDYESAARAADYCHELYPEDSAPVLFNARMALVDLGDIVKAKALMAEVKEEKESLETVYVKAEIMVCEREINKAEEYLNEKYAKYKEKRDNGTLFDDNDDEENEEDSDDMPDFAIDVAAMYCDHNLFDRAATWIERADVPTNDYALEYYDVWARIHMAHAEYDKAETALNKILDIDPFNVNAWLMMSDTQFRSVRFLDALQSAEYAIAIDPLASDAYLSKGNCLYALNRMKEAEAALRKYKELEPDDVVGDLLLATTLFCSRRTEEAYRYARIVVDNIGSLPLLQRLDALHTCATIGAKNADMGFAEKCCDMLSDLGMPEEEIDMVRGSMYLEATDVQLAVTYFGKAVRESNFDINIIVRIGVICYDAGAYPYSYRLLKDAVESTKADDYTSAPPPSIAFLAAVCRKLGKKEEYLYYLPYAVRLMPFDTSGVLSENFPEGTLPKDYEEIEKGRM